VHRDEPVETMMPEDTPSAVAEASDAAAISAKAESSVRVSNFGALLDSVQAPPTPADTRVEAPRGLAADHALPIPCTSYCRSCLRPVDDGSAPQPEDLFPPDLAPICRVCQEEVRQHDQSFDDYLVVRRLGVGGMGVVSLALRKADGMPVAIKTITPAVNAEPRDLQRFLREAAILRDLLHPKIVAFREMGTVDDRPYIVMDYVRGTDASRLVKAEGPLAIGRAVGLVCQLLEALEYAHAKNYVHRDIKPANLLLTHEDGREVVKVADFGLARIYQASKLSGVTLKGDVGGTIAYMPPEQLTNFREAKPAADRYAAGATLYNLLTNSLIYDLPRRYEMQMLKILHEDPVRIQDRRADIPDDLAEMIHRALLREPDERFADVTEMREALLPFCVG
jgi:serine/threonine-protein kinase